MQHHPREIQLNFWVDPDYGAEAWIVFQSLMVALADWSVIVHWPWGHPHSSLEEILKP